MTTLTLISGGGTVGALDVANDFSTNLGATWGPVYIVAPGQFGYPATGYDTITGTNYISRAQDGTTPAATTTRFRTFFALPANFQFPVLALEVHADNKATIFLNGNPIGAHANNFLASNFQNPAESFGTSNVAYFQAGQNVLEVYLFNNTGVSALDYKASVGYATITNIGLSPCKNPTIKGTSGNDAIVALGGPNIIDAGAGNDSITTGNFNDIICGGLGNDSIQAEVETMSCTAILVTTISAAVLVSI